jgi:hypothetical protein
MTELCCAGLRTINLAEIELGGMRLSVEASPSVSFRSTPNLARIRARNVSI